MVEEEEAEDLEEEAEDKDMAIKEITGAEEAKAMEEAKTGAEEMRAMEEEMKEEVIPEAQEEMNLTEDSEDIDFLRITRVSAVRGNYFSSLSNLIQFDFRYLY